MRKRRVDSYFGIHFDFHANEGETVARVYRPDIVANLLDRVKPDFVQCDTKGHAGLSSYPTKAGTPAFEIKEDVLKMWRELTKKRDIALYAHHSGLYDRKVVENHPDWAVKNENGEINPEYISPFSPYADEILIPQLKEIALNYELDGAWIDGDCWVVSVDYSDYAVNKYFEETGKKPPVKGDSDYEDYRDFCKKGFHDYVRHYLDEMKKIAPDFQITSNWIFSAHMPVKPDVDVEFLSGDYDNANSVASARHHGRCVANKNLPWDLLAWGQNARPGAWTTRNRSTKEYIQYCQEASEIIAMGGAFEFFNIMYGSGGCVQEWAIPIWEKVAEFVREREDVCFKSSPVKEIAVLFPEEKTPHDVDRLYILKYNGFKSLCSWIDAIQNTQYSCNVINEYMVHENELDNFKVLVVPNSDFINQKTADKISEYIKNGGKVITDLKSNKYFSKITGMNELATEQKLIFIKGKNALAALETEVLICNYNEKTSTGEYYEDNYFDENIHNAAVITNYGKGQIISMCFDFSESYKNNITTAIEDFLREQFEALEFEPVVKVLNNTFVDVLTMKKDGKLLVNLINYSGNHALDKVRSYGSIPPLYNIDLAIKTEKAPGNIRIEPGHKKCDFRYENNNIYLTLDKLEVHKIIVIE
ncbi:MAG: alpha-L-fucosidase [Clostridia bacterium]|nr:alpha-L-fucosidase [Clostridia bacterium]